MEKFKAFVLVFLFGLTSCGTDAPQIETPEWTIDVVDVLDVNYNTVKKAQHASILLANGSSNWSGTIIDIKKTPHGKVLHILTIIHDDPINEKIVVSTFSGETVPAMVVKRDPCSQLSLVLAEVSNETEVTALRIKDSKPNVGSYITSIGSPMGVGHLMNDGLITGYDTLSMDCSDQSGKEVFLNSTNLPIVFGQTGSSLLVNNEVVGAVLAVGSLPIGPFFLGLTVPVYHLGLFVDLDTIHDFLK